MTISFYQNKECDAFPSNKGDFKFLGLFTCKQTDSLHLKGKPISFISQSKGSVDISIRNLSEYKSYCPQGVFQRQHLSSLMA